MLWNASFNFPICQIVFKEMKGEINKRYKQINEMKGVINKLIYFWEALHSAWNRC